MQPYLLLLRFDARRVETEKDTIEGGVSPQPSDKAMFLKTICSLSCYWIINATWPVIALQCRKQEPTESPKRVVTWEGIGKHGQPGITLDF